MELPSCLTTDHILTKTHAHNYLKKKNFFISSFHYEREGVRKGVEKLLFCKKSELWRLEKIIGK